MEGSDEDEPAGSSSQSDHHMTTTSRHHFGNSRDSGDAFSITIIESMKEDYGLFVWPCSVVLAEYVWQQRSRFLGASVVELGAGTSLPGLVATKVGSDVTLTDNANRLEVLDNMRRVCDLNELKCEGIRPFISLAAEKKAVDHNCSFGRFLAWADMLLNKVLGLTWGMWDAAVFNLKPKIILGADVLYDTNAFDDLFAIVTFLLRNTLGSVFITTYHNRSGHHLIEFLMVKWGLKCVKLLDGFSFMPSDKASGLSGNIQLAEIVLNCEPVK